MNYITREDFCSSHKTRGSRLHQWQDETNKENWKHCIIHRDQLEFRDSTPPPSRGPFPVKTKCERLFERNKLTWLVLVCACVFLLCQRSFTVGTPHYKLSQCSRTLPCFEERRERRWMIVYNKMKWSRGEVCTSEKIPLGKYVICVISLFLHWLTLGKKIAPVSHWGKFLP